jgi:hypothetical protein
LLAKILNKHAGILKERVVRAFFASKLALTGEGDNGGLKNTQASHGKS